MPRELARGFFGGTMKLFQLNKMRRIIANGGTYEDVRNDLLLRDVGDVELMQFYKFETEPKAEEAESEAKAPPKTRRRASDKG